jgi:hypothetical protein
LILRYFPNWTRKCSVKMYHFKVEILSGDGSQNEAMRAIFKMFLLGSKKCTKLCIQTQELLNVTNTTLQDHPSFGLSIQELFIEVYTLEMLDEAVKVSLPKLNYDKITKFFFNR